MLNKSSLFGQCKSASPTDGLSRSGLTIHNGLCRVYVGLDALCTIIPIIRVLSEKLTDDPRKDTGYILLTVRIRKLAQESDS